MNEPRPGPASRGVRCLCRDRRGIDEGARRCNPALGGGGFAQDSGHFYAICLRFPPQLVSGFIACQARAWQSVRISSMGCICRLRWPGGGPGRSGYLKTSPGMAALLTRQRAMRRAWRGWSSRASLKTWSLRCRPPVVNQTQSVKFPAALAGSGELFAGQFFELPEFLR
jgi:hypothetical protein